MVMAEEFNYERRITTMSSRKGRHLSIKALATRAMLARNALAFGLLATMLTPWDLPAQAASAKPNIVLVVTDDQDDETVTHMPSVTDLVVRQGATFAHAY